MARWKIDEPAKEYRMTMHVFGATLSPSCACYALRKAGEDFAERNSQVEKAINSSFYVVDCFAEEEAIKFAEELTMVCEQQQESVREHRGA